MAFKIVDRVKDTTTTSGTGSLTLSGTAPTGYQSFSSGLSTNDRCWYAIVAKSGGDWEVGYGQLTAGTTLARTQPTASSNAGALVSLSGATYDVFLSYIAAGSTGPDLWFFGDGADGDLTISSGTTTLTRDMYYKNVTISSTAILDTAGFRVFVSEVLDITAGALGCIRSVGPNGVTAVSATGGALGAGGTAGTLGTGAAGSAGGNGGATTGTQAAAPTGNAVSNGGAGGGGGAGGLGSSGAGGITRSGGTVAAANPLRRWATELQRGVTLIGAGAGGAGGSGGGGDGTAGGGGGGGGGGGRVLYVSCRAFKRSGAAVSAIAAFGGGGGNGFSAAGTNRGGGGGGAGGGGGWIYFAYQVLIGASATNVLDASGGTGGNGGNGTGTGHGGNGGTGGSGGRVTVVNLGQGITTETFGTTGTAGSTTANATGAAGGAGNVVQVTL